TLLTTVGASSGWELIGYGVAALAFLVSIVCVVLIFDWNADHIKAVTKDATIGDHPTLRRLDRVVFYSFVCGVLASVALGMWTGYSHLGKRGDQMMNEGQ